MKEKKYKLQQIRLCTAERAEFSSKTVVKLINLTEMKLN